ncbi:unknown function [Klebsiella phage vB_Kpn_K25PH129C1]|uniref:Tail fiber assembly protein n=1 Tax=Klebsiella phage vB_Kpn_K25PH129C1 TaxID=3071630 RepID=A0AAV1MDB8_9CAUD|nr:unknown function [Klebsiella phage vB_Kpn_K25PH129C1]
MAKFKVGDKVARVIGASSCFYEVMPRKDYYTVTKVSPAGNWIQVDGVARRRDDQRPWAANDFELYEEEPAAARTSADTWDPNVAAILRQEAEYCVKQYNDYIKLQPKPLQPITIQ